MEVCPKRVGDDRLTVADCDVFTQDADFRRLASLKRS
jgi:hypothetical protein